VTYTLRAKAVSLRNWWLVTGIRAGINGYLLSSPRKTLYRSMALPSKDLRGNHISIYLYLFSNYKNKFLTAHGTSPFSD
jgi:hypothetical protein